MQVIQQKETLKIKNRDIANLNNIVSRHGVLLPSSIRCLITGPSGVGKTNVAIALLEHPNGLRFENVYIYSKSLYQPKYVYLENLLKSVKGIGYYSYSDANDVITPDYVKPNSVFIFDDIACDKQDVMRMYFSMGRHKSIDCIYICQTYARIPKHLLRDNANMIVLFKQDEMNLIHVYKDHVCTDMSFEKFKDICSICWQDKYGFLVINKENDVSKGRYRKGFDQYIIL